jgi:hypothetical protein
MIKSMAQTKRFSKTFTVDRSILDYIQRTRSNRSRSERANELMHRGMLDEQSASLEREAAEFFGAEGEPERAESRSFAKAGLKTLARD